ANVRMGGLLATDLLVPSGAANRLTGGAGAIITVDGPVTLAQNNNYAGEWVVAGGLLRVATSTGPGTGTITVGTNGVLEVRNPNTLGNNINFNSDIIRGTIGGTLGGIIHVANNASVDFDGFLTVGDSPNDLTGGGGA